MSILAPGDVLPTRRLRVELWPMKVFSVIMADPNPIHFDPVATAALGLGDRPVNQGTLTMSYPIDVLLDVVGDPARIRRVQCRFLGSVVADDVVLAGGRVGQVADGIATVELWLDQENGKRVLSGTALVDVS